MSCQISNTDIPKAERLSIACPYIFIYCRGYQCGLAQAKWLHVYTLWKNLKVTCSSL